MSDTVRYIQCYSHDGRVGVLIEFSLDMSVTTREPQFVQLSKDLAMHIAAHGPKGIEQLLAQPFVREPSLSVSRRISDVSAALEEHIAVIRFLRWGDDPIKPDEPTKGPAAIVRFRQPGPKDAQ